jgi:hypothetical protein
MKKLILLVLTFSMLLTLMIGCKKTNDTTDTGETTAAESGSETKKTGKDC